jgi:hypothetical protein
MSARTGKTLKFGRQPTLTDAIPSPLTADGLADELHIDGVQIISANDMR